MITFVILREMGKAFHSVCRQMKLMIRPWVRISPRRKVLAV